MNKSVLNKPPLQRVFFPRGPTWAAGWWWWWRGLLLPPGRRWHSRGGGGWGGGWRSASCRTRKAERARLACRRPEQFQAAAPGPERLSPRVAAGRVRPWSPAPRLGAPTRPRGGAGTRAGAEGGPGRGRGRGRSSPRRQRPPQLRRRRQQKQQRAGGRQSDPRRAGASSPLRAVSTARGAHLRSATGIRWAGSDWGILSLGAWSPPLSERGLPAVGALGWASGAPRTTRC